MLRINPYNSLLKKIWDYYAEDVGKSLIHLGAFGWFLSSAAQLGMIVRNKNIDKKEKQFLIPQEIADGVINVGLYYTICQAIKKGCEQLLERGVFMTKRTFDTIQALKTTPNSNSDFIKAMSEFFVRHRLVKNSEGNLSDFYKGAINLLNKTEKEREKILSSSKNRMLWPVFGLAHTTKRTKQMRNMLNLGLKEYTLFKNGVGVIGAVGASILACNIITPITRNLTANIYQKKALKRNEIAKNANHFQIGYKLPVSNTYSKFKI